MSDQPVFPPNVDPLLIPGAQVPGLEAGASRRRLALWRPSAEHVNGLLRNAGDTVLARARWLVRNNGYARAALRSWTAATVGAGIKPSPLIAKPAEKAGVAIAWSDWTDEADYEGVTDFYGVQRRVTREVFLAGECFVRLHTPAPDEGLSVPLQAQILPSEQLPLWRMFEAPNGNTVRLGIEFDGTNKRVAYWFWRSDPTDPTIGWRYALAANMLVRVDASEILHVYDPVEAGQIRGLSSYAAAMVKMFVMDVYDDAELERKKQAARFATFVTKPRPDTSNPNVVYDQDPYAPTLPAYYGPGAFMELADGEDVRFSEPADVGPNYEGFQYRTLLQISAAAGVPYAELSADLSKATYASSRAGLLAFRAEVEAFQHSVLIYQFIRPIYAAWMPLAVIAGVVPITAAGFAQRKANYMRIKAITPKMPWVDPLKDRQAEALAVQNGFKSRSDVIEAEGYDPEEVDARIAADHAREKKLGLDFTPVTKIASTMPAHMPDEPAEGATDQRTGPQGQEQAA